MAPTEGIPIALSAAALFGRLRQKQITRVVEVGSFVEMPLERTREETHLLFLQFRAVFLAHEPILLVHDAEIGQHADRLAPRGVDRLVLGGGYGVQLRQLNRESHRDIGVFGEDAPLLDGQQREFRFERRRFKCISHSLLFYG